MSNIWVQLNLLKIIVILPHHHTKSALIQKYVHLYHISRLPVSFIHVLSCPTCIYHSFYNSVVFHSLKNFYIYLFTFHLTALLHNKLFYSQLNQIYGYFLFLASPSHLCSRVSISIYIYIYKCFKSTIYALTDISGNEKYNNAGSWSVLR